MLHRKLDVESPSLPVLLELIKPKDDEILYYACEALNRHLEDENGKKETSEAMIAGGICSQLVQLVVHPSKQVAIAAIHVVGCIADLGDDVPVEDDMYAGIFPLLVYHLEHSDMDIKREVVRAISRSLQGGSYEQMRHLAGEVCIRAFCDMLSLPEQETVMYCMSVLSFILDMGMQADIEVDGVNPYAESVKECGGFDKLKTMRDDATDENILIHNEAVTLLTIFFNEHQA